MPSTHTSLRYHIVFSTKERYPHIARDWRDELHAYLGGCVRGLGGIAVQIGGVADHVHLLVILKPAHSVADVVREIKKASTNWIRASKHEKFSWQDGYGAFTISRDDTDRVQSYILRQEEHHERVSFQDEYLAFLAEQAVEYDPRYLW